MSRQIQKFMIGIKGFIIDHNKLLLVKSGNGREELWEVPGGRYDVGEEMLSTEEILSREIREELGGDFTFRIHRASQAFIRPLGSDFVFLLAFECEYLGGKIQLSQEHTDFQWVNKNDWQDLPLAPGYRDALDHFWKNR